jgi:UDP-2-acetamido-3-amino-2,3-dideoxy-glucuronate N-acetyltransferase
MIHPAAFIHPKAHVEGATVGARTKVWQFASVIRGTVLGEDCNVASCATLDGPVFGDRCKISQGVAMGPGFLFGNDVFVGPNVTVCNDRWPRAHQDGFDFAALQRGEWAVTVGDNVTIGANAVVLPGVRIGASAVISAGAVVNRSVPNGCLFKRNGTIVPLGSHFNMKRMWRAGEC